MSKKTSEMHLKQNNITKRFKSNKLIPSASRGGLEPPVIFPWACDGGNVWRFESTKMKSIQPSNQLQWNQLIIHVRKNRFKWKSLMQLKCSTIENRRVFSYQNPIYSIELNRLTKSERNRSYKEFVPVNLTVTGGGSGTAWKKWEWKRKDGIWMERKRKERKSNRNRSL